MTDICTTTQRIRCFSGHAVRRCLERGITALHVEQTLEQGVLVAEGEGTGTWARGRLRVVVSRDGMVITAWRTPRRNPKRRIQKSQSRKRREKRRFHVREAR